MAAADFNEQPQLFHAAIVAPTYNNARTLRDVLRRLEEIGLPIFVVNDGSSDETSEILASWSSERGRSAPRRVMSHSANRGKAAALQTGFAAAQDAGFTHCLTIDTDGQLDPADIPALLRAAKAQPLALVVGVRDAAAEDYPVRSRVGRRVSNLMIWLESGVRVADSQCGLRVYPLALVGAVRCRAGHFGFETEIITRAGWASCPIIGVPVSCSYLPPGEGVSHFRPWRDTLRALWMHAILLGRAINPWPFATVRGAGADGGGLGGWRGVWEWINPARAWREVREAGVGRTGFALGLALGVFIGNLPLYGLHTLLSLYSARRLHLHPISVVAGSHISTPPIGPLLVTLAITVGHVLLHGALPSPDDYDIFSHGIPSTLGPLLMEWAIGGVIVGFALAAAAFVGSSLFFRTAFPGNSAATAGEAE